MADFKGDTFQKTAEFSEAPEVEQLAAKIIPQYHDHLKTAKIRYLFSSKAMKKQGRVIAGKAQTAAALVGYFGRCDFVVTISLFEWSTMDLATKRALVDHELCHCFFKVNEKSGERTWTIRAHDVEEFNQIVERHRLWSPDVQNFATVMQQMGLFEDLEKLDQAPRKRRARKG